jgi:hypothetical protein
VDQGGSAPKIQHLRLFFVTTGGQDSLPKAERDITLSTFVPHDIRDRRLLSIMGWLS